MHLRFGARPRRAYVPRSVPEPQPILATIQAAADNAQTPTVAPTTNDAAAPAPVTSAAVKHFVRRRPGRFSRYTPQRPVSQPAAATAPAPVLPAAQPRQVSGSVAAPPPPTPSPFTQSRHVSGAAPLPNTLTAPPAPQLRPAPAPAPAPVAVAVSNPTPRIRKFSTATYEPPVSPAAMPIASAPPVLLVGRANAGNPSGSAAAAITNRKRREPATQGCVSCGIRSRWHSSKKTLN
jgi:hypothetical protein